MSESHTMLWRMADGFQFVERHMIFDIKMEDFHCKACLVAGKHMTNVPATYTYKSVMTHALH